MKFFCYSIFVVFGTYIIICIRYFSYEHFYVIYCKFWELDTDHDFLIDKENLIRYGNHALTYRIVDRIFSQVCLSWIIFPFVLEKGSAKDMESLVLCFLTCIILFSLLRIFSLIALFCRLRFRGSLQAK